jgi:hypothetical protein
MRCVLTITTKSMYDKLLKQFMYSYGAILAITGVAKLISALGDAPLLMRSDPIFNLQFRHVLLAAGILEIFLAIICFLPSKIQVSSCLVAWFSTSLLGYRVGMWYVGWVHPCPCLGGLTDAIHISPQTADTAMKIVLVYLLMGSYGILFHKWWKNRKLAVGRSALGSDGKARSA